MNVDKVLRYTIIGGIFLLPFIPFFVANSMFFPFITGKNFVFRIIVEIIFALWIILALRNITYRPSFSWILIAIFSFIAVIAAADLLGVNPFKSFWSNFERMEGLIGLLHLGAYFLIAGTVLNTKKLWFALANISIGASIIMGIYGLLQISGKLVINQGGVRVDGTMGNAAYLAVYMLFHAFITAILLSRWRGISSVRYFYVFALLLQLFILFQTATRGTILGLAGGVLLAGFLVVLFGREYPKFRKIAVGIIAVVMLVSAGIFFTRDATFVKEDPILSRLASISLDEGSSRFTIWSMAYEGFKERPILGWGQENFNHVFNKYYNPSLYADEPWFDRAHNIFFDWLIAGGILGIVGYLSIFVVTLFALWRPKNAIHFPLLEKSLITGLLAGYFFHNIFVFDNVISYILFFSILAYVYNETRSRINEESFFATSLSSGVVNRLLVPAVIVLMGSVFYFGNIPGISTSTKMIEALSERDITNKTALFREASNYNSLGSQEASEQLIQAAISANRSDVPIENKQAIFTLAEKEMEEQLKRDPNDARHYVFLGSLYEQFGQLEKSKEVIIKALELSPNKQRILFQLAFSYLNEGNNSKALETFERAYKSAPQSDESRIYYAAVAIYSGKDDLSDGLLEETKKRLIEQGLSDVIDNELLLRAYAETGQIDKVLEIWDYRVEKSPNDINIHLSRAATLVRLNRNEEAISEIQKVIQIEPQFKAQGELFIVEIRAGRGEALIQ